MAFPTGCRLFVVAAHPDDDAIGCGGTIALATRDRGTVTAAYVTDGSKSHPNSARFDATALRDLREAEAVSALEILGASREPTFYRLPDGALDLLSPDERKRCAGLLARAMRAFRPDAVLAPWIRDPHPDHIVTSEIAREAARLGAPEAIVAGYEVWAALRAPAGGEGHDGTTLRVELDPAAMDQKRRAILAHRSQTTDLIDDDPAGFRIDAAMLDRWVTASEVLHVTRRASPSGATPLEARPC